MAFRLESGENEVAELRWVRHGASLARAQTADGIWTLKRGGFLNPHVTLRAEGATVDLVRVSAHLNAHRIEVSGRGTYRFHRAGLLVPAWKVDTESGQEVLHIEPVREGRKLVGGAILPSTPGAGLPDLLVLTVVSWYFIVLAWFEDEALVPLEGPEAPPPPPAASVSEGSRGA